MAKTKDTSHKSNRLIKNFVVLVIIALTFLTIILRTGGIVTDHKHGVADWHPDSGRYYVQLGQYIAGNYRPIAKGPLYTGNPYANILFLSWIWHAANEIVCFMGYGPLKSDSLTLSGLSRVFYIFISVMTVLTMIPIGRYFFDSYFVGLLSAFIFAISPLAIQLVHTIKPEPLLTCFLLLSTFFVLLVSKERKLVFYIFAGIFAGLATAVKYNGSVVMLFLFIIHVLKIHQDFQSHPLWEKIVRIFISYRFLTACVLWAFFFYLTEPVLWPDLIAGIEHIRHYLRVTALWALPKEVYGKQLEIFFINIKWIPHNVSLLFKTVNPYFMFLAIIGVLFSKRELFSMVLKLALLPFLLVFILFLTKHSIGEEYLFNSFPFIFILSAVGFYSIYERLSGKLSGKFLYMAILITGIGYGLYIGFSEAAYFSIGNIRYYANTWVNSNLDKQCIHAAMNTLYCRKNYCRKTREPVFYIASNIRKGDIPRPGNIILKTFQLERSKPFMHHLRGHKIMVFTPKGRVFNGMPIIPRCPIPRFPSKEFVCTRFLNGVDFNPGFYTFLLRPSQTYNFRFISSRPLKSVNCRFLNCNVSNIITVNNDLKNPVKMLPFEKKNVEIQLVPSFPWRAPYIYNIFVHVQGSFSLIKFDPFCSHKSVTDLNNYSFYSSKISFEEYFKRTYKYDYNYLKSQLVVDVPLKHIKNNKKIDFYIKKRMNGNYAKLNREPVFLEAGHYLLEVELESFLRVGDLAIAYVLAPPRTLAKVILTHEKLKNLIATAKNNYKLKIPFKVNNGSLVKVLFTMKGSGFFEIKKTTLKTLFQANERQRIAQRYISNILKNPRHSYNINFIERISPDLINGKNAYALGSLLLQHNDLSHAELWLRAACEKNPVNKKYFSTLVALYRKMGKEKEARENEEKLKRLNFLTYGEWDFQSGFALKAVRFPAAIVKGVEVEVKFYLYLPAVSPDQSVFLAFEKEGNFYFGKDFSLFAIKTKGELSEISGSLAIPKGIPSGKYKVYFTFRMPKTDFRYRILKFNKIENKRKVLIKEILINN